jgi:hypothetical protein
MCFDSSFASGKFFQVWQLPPIALWWPADEASQTPTQEVIVFHKIFSLFNEVYGERSSI